MNASSAIVNVSLVVREARSAGLNENVCIVACEIRFTRNACLEAKAS